MVAATFDGFSIRVSSLEADSVWLEMENSKSTQCVRVAVKVWPLITSELMLGCTDCISMVPGEPQFRLAYVSPESRVVGAGDLVDHPKKIALNYLKGYFFIDLFVVLPLPQIMISFVLRKYLGISGANFAKNLLRAAILLQYFPRLFRFLPLLIGQSPTGFIFESAWANFIINLLFFTLQPMSLPLAVALAKVQEYKLLDHCHGA
ncbi:hypothetical protein JHK82_017345 [Glycine max]|uniref:Putative cyclic nucleotide-gated ion channel 20, chloroplastic n=1 Tax=Glycine soja TaxID=3848 RepID=A0A0B2PWN5_GLYSO|nr:hypothetical protein JHK82_017345 [Glycine max]KHN12114.1 Putative cyclic nucleotide-gated ion channel 20, chloroplastic [Glycine soja]